MRQEALPSAMNILRRREPEAGRRAESALALLLAGQEPEAAESWRGSTLTGDGFPVELAFSSRPAAIRYSVEVPAPDARARLATSECLLERLGAPRVPERLRGRLEKIQRSGPLAYGAWVSGRHDASGDGYKLYVEVPEEGAPEAGLLARDLLGHSGPHRQHPLRMVGVDLAGGRTELYFRVDGKWRADLVLSREGPALREALEQLLQGAPPPTVSGFSLALGRRGTLEALSLFAFAHELFGTDAEARRRLLAWGEARGRGLGDYAEVSAPLAERTEGPCLHGMVSLIVPVEAPFELRVGLSPPQRESRS